MNFEQIMIRIGIDGTAIKSGLTKVGSLVKAWGTSLNASFKEYFSGITKGFLGAEIIGKALEFLDRAKEKILTIAHLSKVTGANTNFIQSMMQEAEKAGVSFDRMESSLTRFNRLLGAAKSGDVEAAKRLHDMGVAASITDVRTQNFTGSMHNLAVAFSKLNDKQAQAYLLQQAFGKGYADMVPIFERGVSAIDDMSRGNVFTKITQGAIGDFTTLWRSIKGAGSAAMATVLNLMDTPLHGVRVMGQLLGIVTSGTKPSEWSKTAKELASNEEKVTAQQQLQAMAEKEGISSAEMKNRILRERDSLLEKQAELTSQIADRDKLSVNEMEERARRLTGIKSPLERFRTVTPRMRMALGIRTLEEQSQVEFLRGNDQRSRQLQSEADQIRAANPWLKRMDVNPMLKTESELAIVNENLEPVKRMAQLVTSESTK